MFELIGPAVRADFRRLYPANAKTPTCCPSDDNRTKVTNSVTSARSLWWHFGPYFWPADLTRTANSIYSRVASSVELISINSSIVQPPKRPTAHTRYDHIKYKTSTHHPGPVQPHLSSCPINLQPMFSCYATPLTATLCDASGVQPIP